MQLEGMARSVAAMIGVGGLVIGVSESAAQPQRATPVSELRLDVNGDGLPDVIRIEDPASVSLTITPVAKAGASAVKPTSADGWVPFTSASAIVDGDITLGRGPAYPAGPAILAVASFAGQRGKQPTREAMVLLWTGRKLERVWRGRVGPQGPDREWSRNLVASSRGLLLYQGKPGVSRCDGAPPYLFLKRFDWKQRRFRTVSGNLVRVDAAAGRLTASRQPPAGLPATALSRTPAIFRRLSASSQRDASSARELAPPRELADGNAATSWREGVPGHGRGEFVTARANISGADVAALRVVPGDATSAAAFAKHNRLRRFAVLVSSANTRTSVATDARWVDIPSDPRGSEFAVPYWVLFNPPVPGDCVTLVVDEVYRGSAKSKNETAIAELAVLSAAEMSPAGLYPALADAIAAGGTRGDAASKTLQRGGDTAARALLDAIAKRSGQARARLRRSLAALPFAGLQTERATVVVALVDSLTTTGISESDRQRFASALAAAGDHAIAALGRVLGDSNATAEARMAAANLLGIQPADAATTTLIASAGAAPALLRRTVAAALARPSRVQRLLAAIENAPSLRFEATLWRALGAVLSATSGANGPDDTDSNTKTIATKMIARLATSSTVSATSPAHSYELRYRLFDAAGTIADEAVLAALAEAMEASRRRPRAAALRRVAVAALARNPHPAASSMLLAAATDSDPGVRRAVAMALATEDDKRNTAPTDRALVQLVTRDPWAAVRLTAAGALAPRCRRSGPQNALRQAVDKDENSGVRIAALTALVDCKAAGIDALLAEITAERKRDPELRARACSLLGNRAGPGRTQRADDVARLFTRARNETLGGSEAGLRVAAACAGSLGLLGGETASALLSRAAGDAAFPEIQSAAVQALGHICPPTARPLVADLRASPQRQVAIAANATFRACYR